MEDKELKAESPARMVFENIPVTDNPFAQAKIIYKAMGKYGENLATSFAIFLSNEGWSKLANSDRWIKISHPHPTFTIQEIYKFFIDNN
jgi:hypothetical protein